jgi:Cu(I)/Ag(I) efflux system membrane protein CusA/SilA
MWLNAIIDASVRWRYVVIALALGAAIAGVLAFNSLSLDALPDISDPQVIVRTAYAGQTPEQVERQVTYPLASALAATRGAVAVRGISMYGESFLYIVFSKPDELERARTRVLERLSEVQRQLPDGAVPTLGPDASGVGWVYQYALVDRSGRLAPDALRDLQDYYLKLELQGVPGVAEVATVGGQQREFRIEVDPRKAAARGVSPQQIAAAFTAANRSGGGGTLDLGHRRTVVSADNRLRTLDDMRDIVIPLDGGRAPLRLTDVAAITVGPAPPAGIADLDGLGQVTGGIVIMRQGENALAVAAAVKRRLTELAAGLPEGVAWVPVYDRSQLIERAVDNLQKRLLEEALVVFLVCLVLLWSLRAALAAVLVLPIGILSACLLLRVQGLEVNIMSLGGVAIAIGAMMDAAIVMVENVNRRLAAEAAQGARRLQVITSACVEVGPALFFSLLLITVSFLPVLLLGGREGRLFAPLAYTKTYTMAMACLLAVTLTPALLALLVRRAQSEDSNRFIRALQRIYRAGLRAAIRRPRALLLLALLATLSAAWPLLRSGGEFMPPLDEGDLLYMPTTLPSLTATTAAQLLRGTDAIIKALPEVAHVFGKAGRAQTATDPAPLAMFETTVMLKPKTQWRAGKTTQDLIDELQQKLQIPGLLNSWGYPIRTRIAMLSSGVKTPLGLRITGPDWVVTERFANQAAAVLQGLPGLRSATPSRSNEGVYLELSLRRERAAALGVSARQLEQFSAMIAGAAKVDTVIGDGSERYAVILRLQPELRADLAALRALPVATAAGSVPLEEVADIRLRRGPAEIRSEGGRPAAYVYVDLHDIDASRFVAAAAPRLAALPLPPGCALEWVGEYREYEQAKTKILLIVPIVLLAVAILLYAVFREPLRVLMIMATLPFALVGGLWLVYALGFHLSVAVAVGFIALAGVATEFGVIMVLYLDSAVKEYRERYGDLDAERWLAAIMSGAVKRLRPKLMTVTVIAAGLIPIMLSDAAGCDVMQRIAAPLLGGMITAPLLSMFLLPLVYHGLLRRAGGRRAD